jgi:hypothetical protein
MADDLGFSHPLEVLRKPWSVVRTCNGGSCTVGVGMKIVLLLQGLFSWSCPFRVKVHWGQRLRPNVCLQPLVSHCLFFFHKVLTHGLHLKTLFQSRDRWQQL